MNIKERIQQLIDFKRLSVLAFEKSVGLSNGYLRNTANISAENCAKILATYPDISAEWLMKGEGEMQKSAQSVGDISNSNVAGVNVSGTEIRISNPGAYNALLETVKTYQKITEKYQSQMDEIIALLKKKI